MDLVETREPEAQAGAGEVSSSFLANATEVRRHLVAQGWKVSTSAVYDHVKAGKLRPGKDGRFSLASVEAYAKAHLKLQDGSKPQDKAARLQEEKLEAEVAHKKAQAEREAFKLRVMNGHYIPRAQYEQDLADRARLLRSDLVNFFRTSIDDFILLVEGDTGKAAQALAWCEIQVEEWLNRYARQGQIGREQGS